MRRGFAPDFGKMAKHVKVGNVPVWGRAAALVFAALVGGCTHKVVVAPPVHITIYYCKAGTNDLVRVPFTADPKLDEDERLSYAVTQLLAGPPVGRDAVVLFPQGTAATVIQRGNTAVVNLRGAIERSFQAGGSDETGMFKSLTYTLTAFPGIGKVQVLVGGKTVAALPGGSFELDEPLTRAMFEQ
jgi:spore germination protein GerM